MEQEGKCAGVLLNDLWLLDVDGTAAVAHEYQYNGWSARDVPWIRLDGNGTLAPAPRMGHGFAAAAGGLYVFSGQSYSGGRSILG